MARKRRARRAREGAARGAGVSASDRASARGPAKPGAGPRRPSGMVRGGAPSNRGWEGWNEYAPFYDWENAQTLGRRDVAFWQRLSAEADGDVLELGCGTGRITL